jgi:N,N'-diacetyllegionaminate synthase
MAVKTKKVSGRWPWDKKIFVIGEAGVNHNGSERLALKMVDAAKASGVDAVKFQTWKPGEITGRFAFKVAYQKNPQMDAESRYEMSRRLALPYDAFRRIQAYARKRGILFLSTPDGIESLNFLADELNIPYIKIGSTEVTHPQLLRAAGTKRRPVILSTGLSTMSEVRSAVRWILEGGQVPIVVLHCTSEYPAPETEMNLRAMNGLSRALRLPTGLSDHSMGVEASVAAAAMGACVIEKHFTLDTKMAGPDHRASLDPAGLAGLVASVRRVERMLGDGVKRPTSSEAKNTAGIRRSVVAEGAIPAGTRLTAKMLACKRPATGIEPRYREDLLGRVLNRDLQPDEPLQWKDVK